MCPYSLHLCCLPKEVGANPKPSHYSFSPFLSSISCPLSEVTVLPSTVLSRLRKACWVILWMPLPLLFSGKAGKEHLGMHSQVPAYFQRAALSPHTPRTSMKCWCVRVHWGTLPRQGGWLQLQAGLPPLQKLFWRNTTLEGRPMSLLPFLPHPLMDWGFGVQRKCFQVSTNISNPMVFGKLGDFGVWCLFLYKQPEKQLSEASGHGMYIGVSF